MNQTKLKKELNAVLACDGDCRHCENCDFHSVSNERAIYFAFGCKKADSLGAICEKLSTMRQEIVDALKFELDIA